MNKNIVKFIKFIGYVLIAVAGAITEHLTDIF